MGQIKKGEFDDTNFLAALGAVTTKDVTTNIRYLGGNVFEVNLVGDRKKVRVTFDGSWSDNEIQPGAVGQPALYALLLTRARLQSFNIDPAKYYTNAEWDAFNKKTNGKLYDAADALRQWTGRRSTTSNAASLDFNNLKKALEKGSSAVALSYTSKTKVASVMPATGNGIGIQGSTAYTIRRVYVDSRGRQWIELANPWGFDSPDSRRIDQNLNVRRANDGIITLSWLAFRQANNFSRVVVV